MTRFTIPPDCGNSPKKAFLKDLNISIANGKTEFISDHLHENIIWEIAGKPGQQGKESFMKTLIKHKRFKVKALALDKIITHGSDATVCGRITTIGNVMYDFCDIYTFMSAGSNKIKSIKTFFIQAKG